jgi:hypothetical protein
VSLTTIEYAVDVWDLTEELVWMAFNIDVAGHGECHLLVFKRPASQSRAQVDEKP